MLIRRNAEGYVVRDRLGTLVLDRRFPSVKRSVRFCRLYQLAKTAKLCIPAMNVNDSVTKVGLSSQLLWQVMKKLMACGVTA